MQQPDESPVTVEDIDNAASDLPKNQGPVLYVQHEQLLLNFSRVSSDLFQLSEECDSLKKKLKSKDVLDSLIVPYADRAFKFMCAYCGIVGIILILYGNSSDSFHFADSVMEILVGSTAVTVIGLVGMVLTGIFVGARPK